MIKGKNCGVVLLAAVMLTGCGAFSGIQSGARVPAQVLRSQQPGYTVSSPQVVEFALTRSFGRALQSIDGLDTYPAIGGTAYTLLLRQQLFCSAFMPDTKYAGAFQIEQHKEYPAGGQTEKALNRALKEDGLDIALIEKSPGSSFDPELEYTLVGLEGVVVYTSKTNPVTGLTTAQLQESLLDGGVSTWSRLGGGDGAIKLMKNKSDPIGALLMQKTIFKGVDCSALNQRQRPVDRLIPFDQQVDLDGAIAAVCREKVDFVLDYAPFFVLMDSLQQRDGEYGNIRLLAIDGHQPTIDSVLSGEYPFIQKVYAVTRKGREVSPQTREIIDCLLKQQKGTPWVFSGAHVGNGCLFMGKESRSYLYRHAGI